MKILGIEIQAKVKIAELHSAYTFRPSMTTQNSVIPEKLPHAQFYLTEKSDLMVVDRGVVNLVPGPAIKGCVIEELPKDETVKAAPKKTA